MRRISPPYSHALAHGAETAARARTEKGASGRRLVDSGSKTARRCRSRLLAIQVTFDLYGHLTPGSEAEAAGMLDTHLATEIELAEDAARAADQPEAVGA